MIACRISACSMQDVNSLHGFLFSLKSARLIAI